MEKQKCCDPVQVNVITKYDQKEKRVLMLEIQDLQHRGYVVQHTKIKKGGQLLYNISEMKIAAGLGISDIC